MTFALLTGEGSGKSRLNAAHLLSPGSGRLAVAATPDCRECGRPTGSAARDFCEDPCRRAWNNRRATRGAELYDLVMALRFERGLAKALKLWRLVCRMAAGFRQEDQDQRRGRRSWRDPREVIAARPYLQAVVVQRGRAPKTATPPKESLP